ncbi:MAG: putative Holliday junction resolvase [Frankiales bacterium]|nr:putative Holliday junction resolvase [Frankiales bacterium]
MTEPLALDLSDFDGGVPLAMPVIEPPVTVIAHGRPITQGSKIKGQWGMRDDNAKTLHPWRNTVQLAAEQAMAGRARITADVNLAAVFHFDRPVGHYGTGRNAGILKDSAPRRPTGRGLGDVDKLVRAVCDSLEAGGVFVDDCQVGSLHGTEKVYVGAPGAKLDRPGVHIVVEVLR